jgi:hypothetical protein
VREVDMSSPFVPENHINLFVLRTQTGSDESLFGEVGCDAALAAAGHLEGEFVKAETVALSVPESGRRCLDMRTVMVAHDPGLMAERVALQIIQDAADLYVRQAGEPAPEVFAQTMSQLEEDAGAASITTLGGDTQAAIDRVASVTIQQAAEGDPGALIQSVMDADVGPSAVDAAAAELQRCRSALSKRARAADAHERDARPERARAVGRGVAAWTTARVAALAEIERRAIDEAAAALARANEIAGDLQADQDGPGTPARFGGMFERLRAFFFTDGEAAPTAPSGNELHASLKACLRARLTAAAAVHVRAPLAAAGANVQSGQRSSRLLDHVAALLGSAKAAAATLDEQSAERMRRASGLFLPASAEIRASLTRAIAQGAGETLVNGVIREPLITIQSFEQALQYDQFEDLALAAARRLTNGLREDSLSQVVARLSAAEIDGIATLLARLQPALAFRPGHPAPPLYRRVAVPDGADGLLGMAVRRRFTGVDVVRVSDPLLALGVVVTEVFAVHQLEGYHGAWARAREEMRTAGTASRLVSDRRLLDCEDGLTSNRELDDYIVRGVACGCLAPSKEPPAVPRPSGTWYVMPVGQRLRPSQIDAARLDAVFNGYRLGRSLTEIRTTLRHFPQHRRTIEEQWHYWCQEQTLEQRAARLDAVMASLLPSDELAEACRELKNTLTRELRLLIEV